MGFCTDRAVNGSFFFDDIAFENRGLARTGETE